MITVFNCTEEKDRSGHPKKIYGVTGVKTRDAALAEVAKYKKKSLSSIKLTHSASIGVIHEGNLWWANSADREVLDNGTKCWAIRMRNER